MADRGDRARRALVAACRRRCDAPAEPGRRAAADSAAPAAVPIAVPAGWPRCGRRREAAQTAAAQTAAGRGAERGVGRAARAGCYATLVAVARRPRRAAGAECASELAITIGTPDSVESWTPSSTAAVDRGRRQGRTRGIERAPCAAGWSPTGSEVPSRAWPRASRTSASRRAARRRAPTLLGRARREALRRSSWLRVALGGAARADSADRTDPAGRSTADGAATSTVATAAQALVVLRRHGDGDAVTVEAYRAPSRRLAVRHAGRRRRLPAEPRRRATRALLGSRDARRAGDAVVVEQLGRDSATEAKQARGQLRVARRQHRASDQIGRIVVIADRRHLVAVTGECMLADRRPGAARSCRPRLASLRRSTRHRRRARRARVSVVAAKAPDAAAGRTVGGDLERPHGPAQPSWRRARSPMRTDDDLAGEARDDRRPIYLGGGLIVLAAVFWWNRRGRDQFDARGRRDAARRRARDGAGR